VTWSKLLSKCKKVYLETSYKNLNVINANIVKEAILGNCVFVTRISQFRRLYSLDLVSTLEMNLEGRNGGIFCVLLLRQW
jgi:hypothetical protein